jgi:neutral ceramidase
MPGPLLAGAARTTINPPMGIRMAGYTVQADFATGVHQDLTATCAIVSDGTAAGTAVILGLDMLWIQNPASDEIRAQIGARLQIPAENVLVNSSHTHLGPMTGWYGDGVDSEEYAGYAQAGGRYSTAPSDEWRLGADSVWNSFCCQCNLQARYLDSLRDVLSGLASQAYATLQPARAGSAVGTSTLGVNRRQKLPDGRTIIGINPDGVIDRGVDVIRLDDLGGKTICTIISTACHPIALGPATSEVSSDYGPGRGRFSALSVCHSTSLLCGDFIWARRALDGPK